MAEVKITYETLFDLVRREKSREELQELDSEFYSDIMQYLSSKYSLLKKDGEQAGLFGASESEKVKIQIQNIKKLVKSLYDRRAVKLIRLAINRSKVGVGISNTIAMLPQEKVFFQEVLGVLERQRKDILNKMLYFEQQTSSYSNSLTKKAPSQNTSESLKQVKPGGETKSTKPINSSSDSQNEPTNDTNSTTQASKTNDESKGPSDNPSQVNVKVKFKKKVPRFLGKDMAKYGPYEEGDEAVLPVVLANILLKTNRVEELN